MANDILILLKEHGIISALLTGVFGFLSILAGVAWATRKSVIIKRAKIETKERMKIENNKEIIAGIRCLPFIIDKAKDKISKAIGMIFVEIYKLNPEIINQNKSGEAQTSNLTEQEKKSKMMSAIGPVRTGLRKDMREELSEIEGFVFLLECDLQIHGKEKTIENAIEEIKEICKDMESSLDFTTHDKTTVKIHETLGFIALKYFSGSEIENQVFQEVPELGRNDKKIKNILLDLLDIYLQRLN